MDRSEARMLAFGLVFQIYVYKTEFPEVVDEFAEMREDLRRSDLSQYRYILKVVRGVYDNLDEIDGQISRHLREGWTFDRLSRVMQAILRVAVYEILYMPDIPYRVSANEAVKLSKRFDTEDAPPFLNGVLAGIIRDTSPLSD